jgi:DNA-binding MarR family transcriptional regulator
MKPSSHREGGAEPPAYPRVTYLIKEVERAVRLAIDTIVEPMGLTTVQYTALSVLSLHPGTSSAQLARRSFVSAQAANEMVAALERLGMIQRSPAPEGGRALWIHLTPSGRRALARCEAQVDAFEARLFERVPRREAAQFRDTLLACREAARVAPAATAKRGGRRSAV